MMILKHGEKIRVIGRITAARTLPVNLLCMGEVLKDELKKTLKNKKFSVLADESTSLRNEMELSIMFRVVEGKNPVEKFLSIAKIPNGKAETIANAIDKELTDLDLKYGNIICLLYTSDAADERSSVDLGGRR